MVHAEGCYSCGMRFGVKKMTKEKRYYKNHVVKSDKKGKYITLHGRKSYLPKGSRTSSSKVSQVAKKKKVGGPKKGVNYSKHYVSSPLRKKVKNSKKKTIGTRLSARGVYNQLGSSSVGKKFPVLQKDGSIVNKYLRIRSNGSPYFSTRFGSTRFGSTRFGSTMLGQTCFG